MEFVHKYNVYPMTSAGDRSDRIQLVLKGVARVNEMADEIVPEIAWQMGRPVRYGGEFKGFNERSNYVAEIAGSSLAPIVIEDSAKFERRIEREAHGVVFARGRGPALNGQQGEATQDQGDENDPHVEQHCLDEIMQQQADHR